MSDDLGTHRGFVLTALRGWTCITDQSLCRIASQFLRHSQWAFSLLSSYVFSSVLALHAARCDAYGYLCDFEAIQRQSHSTIRTYPTVKQVITLLRLLVAYPAFLAHRIPSICSCIAFRLLIAHTCTASPLHVLGQPTSNTNDVQSDKDKVDRKLLY